MVKILVTSGAGYIGSVLIPILLNESFEITVYNSLVYGGSSLLLSVTYKNFFFFQLLKLT